MGTSVLTLLAPRPGEMIVVGPFGQQGRSAIIACPIAGPPTELSNTNIQTEPNMNISSFSEDLNSIFDINTNPTNLQANSIVDYETQSPLGGHNNTTNNALVYPTAAESSLVNDRNGLQTEAQCSVPDRREPEEFWNLSGYQKIKNDFDLLDCFQNCQNARCGSRGFLKRHNLCNHLRKFHGQEIPRGAPVEHESYKQDHESYNQDYEMPLDMYA
ncbi:hypothetical protein DFP73DRAFT_530858 [Morchella snyderi]|nr:hypothetical protein DFP73DRAFT_530858 [Morchella snyderi]